MKRVYTPIFELYIVQIQVLMKVIFGMYMQKALAQNPNLLRTLLGLSFTLIFLLGYAVYGATGPSYYVYETETRTTLTK